MIDMATKDANIAIKRGFTRALGALDDETSVK